MFLCASNDLRFLSPNNVSLSLENFPRATIFLGILAVGVGIAFLGTSKTLGIENNPAMIIMVLMIIGAASGMVSVPVLSEMLEAV